MAVYNRSVIWRLNCDPVARLWSGVGDLPMPANALDPQPTIYRGAGSLISLPSLKTMMNGVADRLEFTLSGVSEEIMRLVLDDRESVEGAALLIGHVNFDADMQYAGHKWTWRGVADILSVQSQGSDTGRQRLVTLSVASGDTQRSNPQITRYTDPDQRRRSPSDRFFDRVAGIAAGNTRRFGARA